MENKVKYVGGVDNPVFKPESSQSNQNNQTEQNLHTNTKTEKINESGGRDSTFERKEMKSSYAGLKIELFWTTIFKFLQANKRISKNVVLGVLAILFNAYLISAIHYEIVYLGNDLDCCHDVGFLIILCVCVYTGLLYFYVIKPYFPRTVLKLINKVLYNLRLKIPDHVYDGLGYTVVPSAICLFLVVDSREEPERLFSLLGIFVILSLGFIFSKHPGLVVWRHVVWGMILQFCFALITLRWEVGRKSFECLGDKVSSFLHSTDTGSGFVFGYLVTQQPFIPNLLNGTAAEVLEEINTSKAVHTVFMFKVLSNLYFFSFFVSMLFHLGTMQWVVVKLGWLLQITVGTTACESMSAAANIFLGQSEAPMVIRPYIPIMTREI